MLYIVDQIDRVRFHGTITKKTTPQEPYKTRTFCTTQTTQCNYELWTQCEDVSLLKNMIFYTKETIQGRYR